MFLQNIVIYLPNYTVSHPRRRMFTQCSINLISSFSCNALLSTPLTELLNNFWVCRIQQRNLMVLWLKKLLLFLNLFYFTEWSSLQSIVCTQLIFQKLYYYGSYVSFCTGLQCCTPQIQIPHLMQCHHDCFCCSLFSCDLLQYSDCYRVIDVYHAHEVSTEDAVTRW